MSYQFTVMNAQGASDDMNTCVFIVVSRLRLTPTRLIHFSTKLISLVSDSFDIIITAILPIIFGLKW